VRRSPGVPGRQRSGRGLQSPALSLLVN
jgi:hypothetical protein